MNMSATFHECDLPWKATFHECMLLFMHAWMVACNHSCMARVMQLNWLCFCGICQMIPLKVWSNTALGCNHQLIYSLYVQLLWYPMYYPKGTKARVQWSKPHSILAPTQDSNSGSRIQNHKRWPLHYHCTHYTTTATIYSCMWPFIHVHAYACEFDHSCMLVWPFMHVRDHSCMWVWPFMHVSVTIHACECDHSCMWVWPFMHVSVTIHACECDHSCMWVWPFMHVSVTIHACECDHSCLWPFIQVD